MERKEVYRIIDGERHYQDTQRVVDQNDTTPDQEKSREAFLIFIEQHLKDAKLQAYLLNKDGIQEQIRKIAGLAVASMEAFGAPERK